LASSYIPLYRKYRPQTFSDIVGQEALVKTLTNAIEQNRVAHAYLFTGPRGTGKTSTARIFAKALNCQNGPTINPCGTCPSCQDLVNGTSIDIIEIDAASNNKVEDARNILEKVQFVPVSGKYKVYIIDEVHMLSTAAFNTLLKTLEEPPKNLVFILATTEPHKVLETIISRCQRFDLRRIKYDLIYDRLKYIVKEEQINISDQALTIIARKSAGGLRDALALLDQASVLSSKDYQVSDSDILNLLGSISEDVLFKVADILAKKDAENLIPIINELVQLGNEPLQILRELTSYFRNLMLLKTAINPEQVSDLLDVSEQFYSALHQQSQYFEVIELAQIIEKFSEYEKILKNTTSQQLWLEVALISICYRQDIQVIKDLEARITALEERLAGGLPPRPVPAFIPPPIRPEAKPAVAKEETSSVSMVASTAVIEEKTKNLEIKEVSKETAPETKEVEEKVETPKVEEAHKVQEQVEETIEESVKQSGGTVVDLKTAWTTLLENIESIPSRMLLYNLAKPVEISAERIVITFNVESFVKQAQESSKLKPLEKAATKMFGACPRIIIRTPLPEDEKKNNTVILNTQEKVKALSGEKSSLQIQKESKPQQVEKISHDLPEIKQTPSKPPVQLSREEEADLDDIPDDIDMSTTPYHISDQARMVLDLFQGKIIE